MRRHWLAAISAAAVAATVDLGISGGSGTTTLSAKPSVPAAPRLHRPVAVLSGGKA